MSDHATFFIQRAGGWLGWDVVQGSGGGIYTVAAGPFLSKRTAHWVALSLITVMRDAEAAANRQHDEFAKLLDRMCLARRQESQDEISPDQLRARLAAIETDFRCLIAKTEGK